jgi:hypothetical protein
MSGVAFRELLLNTVRAVEPILREPGVLVAGSEVLLQGVPGMPDPTPHRALVAAFLRRLVQSEAAS